LKIVLELKNILKEILKSVYNKRYALTFPIVRILKILILKIIGNENFVYILQIQFYTFLIFSLLSLIVFLFLVALRYFCFQSTLLDINFGIAESCFVYSSDV